MLARSYWFDWMKLKDYVKFPTLNSYVDHRIRSQNRFKTMDEAKVFYVINACKKLVPYDRKKFGDYPDILKEEIKNPKYRLIYRDGEIIGRNDALNHNKN